MTKAQMESAVSELVERHMQGGVIMVELPAEEYFETSAASVVALTKRSFDGLYVSFKQPYKDSLAMLKKRGADSDKLFFIDTEAGQDGGKCIHIGGKISVDEFVRAINTALSKLKSSKKFIYIDSMAAITSRNPLSETMRLFEFLSRTVRKHDTPELLLVFNVTKESAAQDFIRNSVIKVDEVLSVA
jgi:KaiC/GvpD/RAD55 family RecA-like ATPase